MELAPTAREQGYIQRFYLYLNLTKPSDQLYLSCTLLDSGGKALRPSYLMNVMKRLFPELELKQETVQRENGLPRTEREGVRLLIEGLKEYREGRGSAQFYELYRWYAKQERYEEKLTQLLDGHFLPIRIRSLARQ